MAKQAHNLQTPFWIRLANTEHNFLDTQTGINVTGKKVAKVESTVSHHMRQWIQNGGLIPMTLTEAKQYVADLKAELKKAKKEEAESEKAVQEGENVETEPVETAEDLYESPNPPAGDDHEEDVDELDEALNDDEDSPKKSKAIKKVKKSAKAEESGDDN